MHHRGALYFAVALVASFIAMPAGAQPMTIGNAKVVVKTVTGTADGTLRTLELQDDVYHNEKITTKEESATQLVFLDETSVTMGPKSELVLDRFVFDPDPSKSTFVMTATAGAFRFASGKLPGKAYKIHTPAATLGVRGTKFDVVIARFDAAAGAPIIALDVSVTDGEVLLDACSGEQLRLTPSAPKARIIHDPRQGCVRP